MKVYSYEINVVDKSRFKTLSIYANNKKDVIKICGNLKDIKIISRSKYKYTYNRFDSYNDLLKTQKELFRKYIKANKIIILKGFTKWIKS